MVGEAMATNECICKIYEMYNRCNGRRGWLMDFWKLVVGQMMVGRRGDV